MRPSRVRYGVVGFALSLAVLAYIQRVAISQAAGPISQDLGLDKAQLGLVFGAFGLSYALFEIPMGLRGDRLGVRRTLTQIVIAWSAFTALTGFAWNFTSMWVVRFLFGAGEAGCFPNLTRMLSQWLPSGERMRAQALMWAFTRWGAAMTPPLVLLAINLVGWRAGFVIFGLMGFIWGLFFLRSFRDDPADHPKVNEAELALLAESRALGEQASGGWLHLLLRPKVFLLVLQYFCFSYVWYFYVTWMPSYLQEAHGQTAAATAALSVLPLLLGGLGSLVSGMLPMWISRRLLAFLGFAATALLLVAVPHMPGVGWVITLMAIASFCSDLTMPISWNACADIGQRYTATVAAAMNMLGNFAGFVAPVVGGFILQANGGDWNLLIYTMGGSAVISALCWIFLDPAAGPAAVPEAEPA
ncbi:MAG TPA: MFS transporter [Sphingobium sp.]|nr:MFS transporter [Sphingobium sp.]